MRAGKRNLITDVEGLRVGNAGDESLKSGVTVLTADKPFTAAVDIMGGAPGTRETDLLAPDKLVQQVDALVLSGGSAFGLDSASGVVDGLRANGRGFVIGPAIVPIVPAAILFDLVNGGDKAWDTNPYPNLGRMALENARAKFDQGTSGAGIGATTANLKGGLGSASMVLDNGTTVGALVAVNAVGGVTPSDQPHFWAAPWEVAGEFGGRGPAIATDPFDNPAQVELMALQQAANTTIAIVATDADLTQAQCKRMATAAHDGMARAILPSHTPFDGDLIFAVSTGQKPLVEPDIDPLLIGHAAAICLTRAVAIGVYHAKSAPNDIKPTWHDMWHKP